MSRARCMLLTKSTLSSMVVHVAIVVHVAPGIIKGINKLRWSFI
jgi:hypothetical protein